MQTICVTRLVNRPASEVFAVLSDHAGYARLPLVQAATLERAGTADPNGLGALRHVTVNHVLFVEDIVQFEPPLRFRYHVQACYLRLPMGIARIRIPFQHSLGEVSLVARGENTEIRWVSSFSVPMPLGQWLEPVLAREGHKAFSTLLQQAFPA